MSEYGEQWEVRNTLRTAAIEQAAHDKHLFYYAGRNTHVELRYPEYVPTTTCLSRSTMC